MSRAPLNTYNSLYFNELLHEIYYPYEIPSHVHKLMHNLMHLLSAFKALPLGFMPGHASPSGNCTSYDTAYEQSNHYKKRGTNST